MFAVRLLLLMILMLGGLVSDLCAQGPRFNTIDPRKFAGPVSPPDPRLLADLPPELRCLFRNPDGSCVQCSIGMCGVDANDPTAYTLLVDSEFGPKVRGGSWPGRVGEYTKQRGTKCWNVTGKETYDAMVWAAESGRRAAIGFKTSHFCTLMDTKVDSRGQRLWYVCDNNTPEQVHEYSDSEFRRLHEASGPWCVILDRPPPPLRPKYVEWWK